MWLNSFKAQNMDKYNFELDINGDNSNSVILRNIKPNSKILEFGCAFGRMTKYLKETLNCQVTIVEKDYESFNIAKQYSTNGYNLPVEEFDTTEKFDYIIFADVLEHLFDPESALTKAKSYLNGAGSIWISIPNIGHNSVLIDLYQNKFEYRKTGLLDDTHIRFFTRSSLTSMVERCGLSVANKIDLLNTVENTEFGNKYEDVDIGEFLRLREDGEVYQFVWGLRLI